MRRPGMLALCLALAVPLLLTHPAAADGLYFSEGFGGTKFENELGGFTGGAFRIRVALGYRAKRVAVEAFFGGDVSTEAYTSPGEPDLVSYGLDAKYLFPISKHIEVYLRGSMSRAMIDEYESSELDGYAGRGLGIGTGVQLKGRAPLLTMFFWPAAVLCASTGSCKKLGPEATFAIYLDQGYDFYRLHGAGSRAGRAVDAEATRWTLGFAIGADF
jgi:hypothetical protein